MSTGPNEAELFAQAVRGERVAMETLLMRHHDRLSAAIQAKLPAAMRGAVAAQDICQEAYVAAFRKLATFDPADGPEPFYRWLRTIAERKLADAIRAHRAAKRGGDRRRVHADQSSIVTLLGLVATDQRSPSRSVARREAIFAVQDALERLPEDYREVLRLRYLEGLDVAETAAKMERGPGAVRMLCVRALRHLEAQLGDAAALLGRADDPPSP